MRQDDDADGPILPKPLAEHAEEEGHYVDIHTIDNPHFTDYSHYQSVGEGLASTATLDEDGRIVVSFDLQKKLPDLHEDHAPEVDEFAVDTEAWKTRNVPKLSIVIMIVGSRGDVQPYVALGKRLLQDGHRVRIATHDTFRKFVRSAGLEFHNIGGDPQQLMSYMVKNPGLIPGIESMTNGDIGRKRDMLREMINGCWRACYEPDDETGQAFAPDVIISNPPAFGHVHCAEALGIPLQLSFSALMLICRFAC
ncbi:UDP-Glycosyltransferase/glycogen phosphorylase [Gloeophyllum trabeum ATCC 11539]|uniref:UDP-Glycosyltransferase/glycogen phosphorylase n=1 Tax=Gloeophyllum trabeum (strain ATCC 11539 / FP-39264 / Madison 617) TaxID=670483 RepID=S7PT69_GLOTA|nr:UDP-Glycosyltransferase/glycogen phosphorylase [Gloeophyllum trabeum ATCC 11539]EPQ50593.1 UDP-Glycosyltransferase/glycogen phosphorylase [Gloeophyllum trabeum ATCC 11539]